MVVVVTAAAATASPAAPSAKQHRFSATYTGRGHGQVHGRSVSGSARLRGRGKLIGRSTLIGSAGGVFISRVCVVWSGTGVLKGKPGSIALRAHGARACAGTDANVVSFAGIAKVAGGTGIFKGARGRLPFSGTYIRRSGAVSISFKGLISF